MRWRLNISVFLSLSIKFFMHPEPHHIRLASTVQRYQIEHPELNKGDPGRVALSHRAEMNRELARIALGERLAGIVSAPEPDEHIIQNLVAHALEIRGGDKKKAEEFLATQDALITQNLIKARSLFRSEDVPEEIQRIRASALYEYNIQSDHLVCQHLLNSRRLIRKAKKQLG